jgi:hypothetical protein
MRAIVLEVILTRINPRVDGSMSLGFSTGELDSQHKLVFLDLQNKCCKMLLEPKDSEQEIPVEVRSEAEPKTPSQRLRACLWVLWDQQGKKGNFNDFYASQIDRIVERIKTKLD